MLIEKVVDWKGESRGKGKGKGRVYSQAPIDSLSSPDFTINNNNNNNSEVLLGAIIHRPDAPLASLTENMQTGHIGKKSKSTV